MGTFHGCSKQLQISHNDASIAAFSCYIQNIKSIVFVGFTIVKGPCDILLWFASFLHVSIIKYNLIISTVVGSFKLELFWAEHPSCLVRCKLKQHFKSQILQLCLREHFVGK